MTSLGNNPTHRPTSPPMGAESPHWQISPPNLFSCQALPIVSFLLLNGIKWKPVWISSWLNWSLALCIAWTGICLTIFKAPLGHLSPPLCKESSGQRLYASFSSQRLSQGSELSHSYYWCYPASQHRVSKAVFRQHSLRELGAQMLIPASHLMIYDGVFNDLHFGDA